MGEQILPYYLKVFKIVLIILLISNFFYYFYILNKNIKLKDSEFVIEKGEKLDIILKRNIPNLSSLNIFYIKIYYQMNKLFFNKFIHFGNFYIEKNTSFIDLFNIINKPSNIKNKLTIIEGWSKYQINQELLKHFDKIENVQYEDIIADTYYYQKDENFQNFLNKLKDIKDKYFDKYKNNEIYKYYSIDQIMIIGSLIEKEGLDLNDKRKISSVIFNRLNKGMKLQIDATVVFALTNGNFDLKRKLLLNDLKINHPYNTYKQKGLPPKPISFVGKKTIDIIFENYKSDFLFYFFDKSLKRHIFSTNYKNHIKKLNEYRSKQ